MEQEKTLYSGRDLRRARNRVKKWEALKRVEAAGTVTPEQLKIAQEQLEVDEQRYARAQALILAHALANS